MAGDRWDLLCLGPPRAEAIRVRLDPAIAVTALSPLDATPAWAGRFLGGDTLRTLDRRRFAERMEA